MEPSEQAAATEQDLHALLLESPGLRELEAGLSGFNIFRVMKFAHGELRHSNMLAWLLAPDESHGLGDRFLRRWLMRVQHEAETPPALDLADLDSALFRSVRVDREWRNIDLVVRIELDDSEWVIAIENKVHATQSKGQLARYKQGLEAGYPNARRLHVFLTLHEEDPEDGGWVTADYKQILETLKECVAERGNVLGAEPKVLIDHYLKTIEGLLMPDAKLVALAQRIYDRHHRALDFIFEQRSDPLAFLSEEVAKLMRASAEKLGIEPMRSTKSYVRFIPKAWDVKANRAGLAWGNPDSAYILCEVVMWGKRGTLKIVEGRSPATWRAKLYELARSDTKIFRVRQKMPGQFMSVYQHPLPEVSDLPDSEDAEARWKYVSDHITKNEAFKQAVDRVTELLKELPSSE